VSDYSSVQLQPWNHPELYPSKVNKRREEIAVPGRDPPIMRDMNQAEFGRLTQPHTSPPSQPIKSERKEKGDSAYQPGRWAFWNDFHPPRRERKKMTDLYYFQKWKWITSLVIQRYISNWFPRLRVFRVHALELFVLFVIGTVANVSSYVCIWGVQCRVILTAPSSETGETVSLSRIKWKREAAKLFVKISAICWLEVVFRTRSCRLDTF
jgi:hypothetical protein